MTTKHKPLKSSRVAAQLLEESVELKQKAEALMAEHGITEMLAEADTLKQRATEFCVENEIERLELSNGRYGKLIESTQERVIVGTKDEMPVNAPRTLRPLKSLVSKEVWMKITKRVPDADKIEQAIGDGLLTLDDVAPAYFERMRKPYLRVFGG
jgi:hypothetical protein